MYKKILYGAMYNIYHMITHDKLLKHTTTIKTLQLLQNEHTQNRLLSFILF